MSELAGFPAWYWQVFGVLCGLALGVLLGAIRMRRRSPGPSTEQLPTPPVTARQGAGNGTTPASPPSTARAAQQLPDPERLPRVMVPAAPPAQTKTGASGSSRTGSAADTSSGNTRRSKSSAGNTATGSGSSIGGVNAGRSSPQEASAAAQPTASPSTRVTGSGSAPPAPGANPVQAAPAQARQPATPLRPNPPQSQTAHAADPPVPGTAAPATAASPPTPPDAVAVLQEYTTELLEQLRTTQSTHTQELQARNQLAQEERRRHETLLESLRQEHSAELNRLMGTMAEQVDLLHQQYSQRIKQLESDIERLRLLGNSTVSPAELPADTLRAAAPAAAPAPLSSASAT